MTGGTRLRWSTIFADTLLSLATAGQAAGVAVSVGDTANSPQVQDALGSAMEGLNFRSPPQQVVKEAGTHVAKVASFGSFGLFVAFLLGAVSAALGGAIGGRRSIAGEARIGIDRRRAA